MTACETVQGFCRKFFSIIIAVLMAFFTFVYLVAASHLISETKSFGKSGFAYFLAIIVSIVAVVGYIVLHVVPRKAYRLLYALTGLFLLSGFFISHSMGLSAPTVNDCRISGHGHHNFTWSNVSADMGEIQWVKQNHSSRTEVVTIGSLGQEVSHCGDHVAIFVATFLLLILYIIGIFDVQKVLLTRVKSKTYGERFVEMGISN